MKDILLASKSPQRKNLLSLLDLNFSIEVREIQEIFPKDIKLEKVPEYLAKLKASAFYPVKKNQVVITADTVVLSKGEILGKPKDSIDAKKMLNSLSGSQHEVITGVCISSSEKIISFSKSTKVHFKKLSKTEIDYYLGKYKPYDKAGSYGIQEWIGAIGITKIEGSYFNVVGLPVHELHKQLFKHFM
mgnify:CR=1 FL=1|tara:strand:+ start:1469 stop:2032 length:564 start_codon:yes stop_codon:yes gene_type:complete